MDIEFRPSKVGENVLYKGTLVAEIFKPLRSTGDYWCRRTSTGQMVRDLTREEAHAQAQDWVRALVELDRGPVVSRASLPKVAVARVPSAAAPKRAAPRPQGEVIRVRLCADEIVPVPHYWPPVLVGAGRRVGRAVPAADAPPTLRQMRVECPLCGAATGRPRKHVAKCHPEATALVSELEARQAELLRVRLAELRERRAVVDAARGRGATGASTLPSPLAGAAPPSVARAPAPVQGATRAAIVAPTVGPTAPHVASRHPGCQPLQGHADLVKCLACGSVLGTNRAARHAAERCPMLRTLEARGTAAPRAGGALDEDDGDDPLVHDHASDAHRERERDATWHYAHDFREDGRFGSHASHDGYGEDDRP